MPSAGERSARCRPAGNPSNARATCKCSNPQRPTFRHRSGRHAGRVPVILSPGMDRLVVETMATNTETQTQAWPGLRYSEAPEDTGGLTPRRSPIEADVAEYPSPLAEVSAPILSPFLVVNFRSGGPDQPVRAACRTIVLHRRHAALQQPPLPDQTGFGPAFPGHAGSPR